MGIFQRVRERIVFENRWVQLFDDDVLKPDGKPGTYVRFRYKGNPPGVVIVPRLPDGRVLMLQAYRYAQGVVSVEFPRGSGDVGEPVEVAARRELMEETALQASSVVELGVHLPDSSIVETQVHIVLAEVVSIEGLHVDTEEEGIAGYLLLTMEELRAAIADGTIRDGFSLGAFGLMAARGLL